MNTMILPTQYIMIISVGAVSFYI